MRTLIEAARTMLIQSNLDKRLWAEAVNTAVYIEHLLKIKILTKLLMSVGQVSLLI